MFTPKIDDVIKVMKNKKYAVFSGSGFDLNVVGIRSYPGIVNKFDDTMCIFWKGDHKDNNWEFRHYPITTDPGIYWLKHPMSPLGTAIVKEGQYRKAYVYGYHLNKYPALIQFGNLTVVRDFDRDNELDYNSGRLETGNFGINIHCSQWQGTSLNVDNWSAGCQVFANWNDFEEFLAIAKLSLEQHPSSLTYTLLNQKDFS